ncbi:dipeptide/oligopeptide/nickel ABC transporter permease/ATP-binding protein [Microbacterium resistens]|nr:dipeptide/oligopeptide/nickel ABC transporter permease/ATP-binding protein [Microbacterium resistens]
MPATATLPADVPPARRGGAVRRLIRNPLALVSLVVLLVIIVACFLAGWLSPHDPARGDLNRALLGPSAEHLLGTDRAGRDILSRLLVGGQASLLGALLALAVSVAVGVIGGLLAGYYGRWFDTMSGWFAGLLMAMPAIVVLLAVRAALGPSVWVSMAVFGVIISPAFFWLVRTTVRTVRNELYVDAARVSGLRDSAIIVRHVGRVVRAPIIIQAALVAGVGIGIQAGLEFLGIGDATIPTWGNMLSEGFRNIYIAPLTLLWPAVIIGLVTGALAILGSALRDALEDGEGARPRRAARTEARSSERRQAVAVQAEAAPVESPDPEALLSVRGLRVGYRQSDGSMKTVVHGVDLDIRRGEVLGIVGESGSGKSQSAFAVLGLLPEGGEVLAGDIVFDGQDLRRLSRREMSAIRGRRIAYIPQEPMSNLDPAFRIGFQLVEPMRVRLGVSRSDAKARALELLTKVGIADPQRTFDAYPHEISGGMAQRVLIAGALSCEPELIVADEPTTALDVTVQAEILDLLRVLRHDTGVAVIVVTHNFGVVADLCDRVGVMQHGRIVETAPVRQALLSPSHPYTQALLSALLHGGPSRDEIDAATLEDVR